MNQIPTYATQEHQIALTISQIHVVPVNAFTTILLVILRNELDMRHIICLRVVRWELSEFDWISFYI